MTDRIRERVREILEPYAGRKLVVAVSGGLDSVALLDLLLRVQDDLKLKLVVAHVDHGMRRSSAKDARFVEQLAASYSLPFAGTRLELNPGGNQEARAREARYRWLEQVRKRQRADFVVTAHQADDQVETLFLHLARGSGLQGLSGMKTESGTVLRPLLDIPRKELTRYVRRRRLRHRLDPTNKSLQIARNRVRHQVIRSLQRINPQLVATVGQSMRVLEDEYQVIRHLADSEYQKVLVRAASGRVVLGRAKLVRMKRGVRHLVFRRAIEELLGDTTGFALRHLENLDELLGQQTGRSIHLPRGLTASRQYAEIVLKCGGTVAAPKRAKLPIPGEAAFGSVTVSAKPSRAKSVTGQSILVDAAAVGEKLLVRSPKVGDRFKPVGMRGSKLVSNLLTDAKVPRDERPWVPVVTTAAGEIIWVAGHRADRRFAAKPSGRRIILKLNS